MILKKFSISEIGEVVQKLYEAEINFDIYSRWDDGFDFKIQNGLTNGYSSLADSGYLSDLDFKKIEDVISGLAYTVCMEMPDTPFAGWYNPQTPSPEEQPAANSQPL